MHLYEKIANRLKRARIGAGYKTAKEFASKHNIPYITYAQHESGKRRLSAKYITEYSKFLDIESNWLLGEVKPKLSKSISNTKSVESNKNNATIDTELFLQIVKQILYMDQLKNEQISIIDVIKTAAAVYNHLQTTKTES